MESMEFLETMMRPEMGDEMTFRIDKVEDDGTTFSLEAVNGMAENMRAFTMARTFARWKASGKPPRSMTATLTFAWDDDADLEEGGPWWSLDDEGATVLDGADRVRAKLGQ